VGLNLYVQYFLLKDETVSCLFVYGLSLNCSLDGLIFFPFIFYRVIIKALKQMYRDNGNNNEGRPLEQLYANNDLDLNMMQAFLGSLQSSVMGLVGGVAFAWAPHIFFAGIFRQKHNGELNFFYDHIKNNIYNNSIINPNN
tara:strand:+ start:34 stop:456 length:423 start_codon:yes stop_codon:yes gene_type:complete